MKLTAIFLVISYILVLGNADEIYDNTERYFNAERNGSAERYGNAERNGSAETYGSPQSAFGTINNIFNAGKDISFGIGSQVPKSLPSLNDIFQFGKNALAGYPFQAAASAINKLCSVALSSESIQPKHTPDVYKMNFVLMTPNRNYSFPLVNAEDMWLSPAFNTLHPTVILVTGWLTDLNEENDAIYRVSSAYLCRGNVNFVVVDTARFVDTLYTWSAFNTEEVGKYIGQALVLFGKYGDISSVHLIGHSLGAHIVGAAGRSFTEMNGGDVYLPRITGLDPAKPCFNEGEVLTGLSRGDAQFVDIIHTNRGVLGQADSIGDVDFYPGGLNPLPIGCLTVICAHGRAWEYYAESVLPGNEQNFQAIKCTSLGKVQSGKCAGKHIPMGYAVPKKARGNYFLEVNGESPFGKNSKRNNIVRCH